MPDRSPTDRIADALVDWLEEHEPEPPLKTWTGIGLWYLTLAAIALLVFLGLSALAHVGLI